MATMSSAELRNLFLEYFRERGHELVASSQLVPGNDPTLLFTNAGMVQFKDVFLGREQRSYSRAATAQRCVRAGGKHNDLENVGYTARHHTFFEMLGNFSFGDYFKRDAIHFAWEFLTVVLKLPPERLWVTVFDQDKEAEAIWLESVKVDPNRFSRIGAKDNFWSMGDVGPCGPCTEIFYDHGAHIPGGPPGSPDEDGDRYIEIWNLVFMQYDRAQDGTLTPLPKPSVDTGMGLERLAAVMQGVHSNYEIDLFQSLLKAAAELAELSDTNHASLRVIADHIRSCAFLVADGVVPSNEGRGYVLRRIMRRAIRHGYKLGIREVFFHKLVAPLCNEMGGAYPELMQARAQVEKVLQREEERFAETLEQGMGILQACVEGMQGKQIPGETAFLLYDTYGFPVDLTADFARENGLTVDTEGFERCMDQQRERARAANQFGADYAKDVQVDCRTEFTGYQHLQEETRIAALFRDGQPVAELNAGEAGLVVLERTPFYGESGGQAGDVGKVIAGDAVFDVADTKKQGNDVFLHHGKVLNGSLKTGSACQAVVDGAVRQAVALNHSATHLLHAALRKILGGHVTQKGSLVDAQRLRFDFVHDAPMTAGEIAEVERLVNEQIRRNQEAGVAVMGKDEAMAAGAMALFGEKYGDQVRVVKIGDFSTELCGGTHVGRAGDIGLFKIVTETGVAAGIRRVEAVTGENAVSWLEQTDHLLQSLCAKVKVGRDGLDDKIQQLLERGKSLEKEIERLKGKLASSAGGDLAGQAVEVAGIKVLAARLQDGDPKALRDLADQLKNKLGSAAIVLALAKDGKVSLVAGVTQDQTSRLSAVDLVNLVAASAGGKGGGRPDMAQAGGTDSPELDKALAGVAAWVGQRLQ
ncbi:alanine--tRNA ligase [Methylogaea oryzae]|uniref:Alanine--tRNA ligase n=1 Tax=Methylogaea oryzae TaxID=1295382 RepID=A0A8D4VQ72_9GAMM|nr:alanine--tRNA ligase [Methylogaea oryzae]BBL70632.1 alanine--tRNA ligase [Methylogaea oryzae]